MKIIISPAKIMKYKQSNIDKSKIIFPKKTSELLEYLKQFSVEQLHDHMKISFKTANTVYDYYHNDYPYTPAIFCYQGTVFKQLNFMFLCIKQWVPILYFIFHILLCILHNIYFGVLNKVMLFLMYVFPK